LLIKCAVCKDIIYLCNFLPHVIDPQDLWCGNRRLCFAPCNCLSFNMIIIGYPAVFLPLLLPFWWTDWTLWVTVIIYLSLYCLWGSLPSTSAPLVDWYDYWSHSHLFNFVLFMLQDPFGFPLTISAAWYPKYSWISHWGC
jgi:hypothetical protein